MSKPPALFKPFNKYLIQARKLDKVHPVAAYYCRYHFLQKGVGVVKGKNEPEAKQFLGDLMGRLEKAKPQLPEQTKEEKQESILELALNVFTIADNEDRAGNASKGTAIKFRTCSTLFEACSTLGDVSEDVNEKLRYARWKQVDIMKAIKEGRKPTPGPPGGEEQDEANGVMGDGGAEEQPSINASEYYRREEDDGANVQQKVEQQSEEKKIPRTDDAATESNAVNPTPPIIASENDDIEQTPSAPSSSEAGGDHRLDSVLGSLLPAEQQQQQQQLEQHVVEPTVATTTTTTTAFEPSTTPVIVPTRMERKQQPTVTSWQQQQQQQQRQYGYQSPSGSSIVVSARKLQDKLSAEIEAERLIGHAQSALRFHDVDSAVEKMKGALAVLIPYQGKQ
eukprot:CAMPEP_0185252170 /NCGR_PEP_ID=MMETSP1359-20130426/1354_1 /TAXON_ID=552665 /ORGANISM="Bigelowiella longifila, Strain CCMP242" /LENGTH=393 /DNA_ID=CAMNT_0027834283 /DNA_START=30 /DNA_END=1211 /DNA_ORIENTATION=-